MGRRLTQNEFVCRAETLHHHKYDYSCVDYVNSATKVMIVCPDHGKFLQTPNDHLDNHKCPQCAAVSRTKFHTKTNEQFLEEVKEMYGDKYDYSSVVYKNALTKVDIKCRLHGSFMMRPNDHLNHHACPQCNIEKKVSRGELRISNFLRKHKIKFILQKTFDDCKYKRKLKFDFYLPSKNMLIEYDGQQHFTCGDFQKFTINKKQLSDNKIRDAIKTNYAATRGIRLIRIKYTELTQSEKIMEDALK